MGRGETCMETQTHVSEIHVSEIRKCVFEVLKRLEERVREQQCCIQFLPSPNELEKEFMEITKKRCNIDEIRFKQEYEVGDYDGEYFIDCPKQPNEICAEIDRIHHITEYVIKPKNTNVQLIIAVDSFSIVVRYGEDGKKEAVIYFKPNNVEISQIILGENHGT